MNVESERMLLVWMHVLDIDVVHPFRTAILQWFKSGFEPISLRVCFVWCFTAIWAIASYENVQE